jgi:hypothetical protein
MGFFKNPFKATKAFLKDPVGVASRDLGISQNTPQSQERQQCHDRCFDLHVSNMPASPGDRKHNIKQTLDTVGYVGCNLNCKSRK